MAQVAFAGVFQVSPEDAKHYGPDPVFATPAGMILVQSAGTDDRLWLECFQAFRPDILVLARVHENKRLVNFLGWERSSAIASRRVNVDRERLFRDRVTDGPKCGFLGSRAYFCVSRKSGRCRTACSFKMLAALLA